MEEPHPSRNVDLEQLWQMLKSLLAECTDTETPRLAVPGYQWEMVECAGMGQVFIALLSLGRIFQVVKERLSLQGNKESASQQFSTSCSKM